MLFHHQNLQPLRLGCQELGEAAQTFCSVLFVNIFPVDCVITVSFICVQDPEILSVDEKNKGFSMLVSQLDRSAQFQSCLLLHIQ